MWHHRKIFFVFLILLTVAFFLTITKYFWGFHQVSGHVTKLNENEKKETSSLQSGEVEITIVTMYLNIGAFQKGNKDIIFSPSTYQTWFTTWGWLTNRVIGFFDSDEDLNNFRKYRSSQPADRTVAIKINRTELPAFKHLEKIRKIFQSPGYPKHLPNTVVPEYSCAMHAKYDVLQMAIEKGLVHTKHMAWLDIGLFRNLLDPKLRPKSDTFTLEVPDNFNSSCVSMSEVSPRKDIEKSTPKDLIWNNMVWVSGAFHMGTKKIISSFAESYRDVFEHLLEQSLTSTDQQIIASMYSPAYIHLQKVDMQPYPCIEGQFGVYGSACQYFYLGYLCKDAAEKRRQGRSPELLGARQSSQILAFLIGSSADKSKSSSCAS